MRPSPQGRRCTAMAQTAPACSGSGSAERLHPERILFLLACENRPVAASLAAIVRSARSAAPAEAGLGFQIGTRPVPLADRLGHLYFNLSSDCLFNSRVQP